MLGSADSHLFDEMTITQSEWAAVRSANGVLDVRRLAPTYIFEMYLSYLSTSHVQIFLSSTLMMEGDSPTGARVLPEYRRMKKALQKMEQETQYKSLHKMIGVMLKKLKVYHQEALN